MPWPNDTHAAIADQQVERGGEQPERADADHEVDHRLCWARHVGQGEQHDQGDQRQ